MKSKSFNFSLSFNASRLLACVILFLLGTILTTSLAAAKTPKKDNTDTNVTKSEKNKAGKPVKVDKSDKNAAEDFGGGEGSKSDGKPGEKDNPDDEIEYGHPVIPELENETYVELAKIGKLDEKQQKLLVRIQKKREIALERWDKANEKKLKKMKRKAAGEEKESRRAKLELKVANFEALRNRLAASFDTKARKVCKSSQLADYNTQILYRTAMNEFSDMQIQLSDEEALKVKQACGEVVKKKYRSPVYDLTGNKKIQFHAVYAVAKNALTKEQFKKYKKIKIREDKEKRRHMQEQQNRTVKSKKSHRNK